MPLPNDNILSKPMITNVAITHFFAVYKRHIVNGINTYLVKEVWEIGLRRILPRMCEIVCK
jgi:hypothetical protein